MIRSRQLQGFKFFRQYGNGPYILDFYCPELKLVIELDGGQHNKKDHQEYDLIRTTFLVAQGIHVLRFWNNEVLANRGGVWCTLGEIATKLQSNSS